MTAALAVERSGPLIAPWTIVLAGVLLLALLGVARTLRVRERAPWLFPEVAAFAALALLHLLFFWQPYRTEARVPRGGGDLASFFYPMHAFAAREVQDGRLPFWNPHLFSGAPHLANFQTATLYPPNLLAYLLANPFEYATLELLALLHYLLASWGTYWLARTLGISRPGSVLAGGLLAYSGFMVAHLGHYSMLATVSWMPWVFAAIIACVRRGSWVAALGGAVALACATLGGHQPLLLMSLTLAALLAGFELWRVRGAGVVRLACMAGCALLLTLPVLGPSFELTGQTVRGGLSYAGASAFSIEPTALLHLLVPTVYGSNPTDYWGPFSNTEIWGYVGVLSLFLAALGVVARSSRTRRFWLLVGVLALLYALGPFTPLHGWAYAFLPGFDRVRAAGRALLYFDLAVALLAGFGLDTLLRGRAGWSLRERGALRRGVPALGVAALLVLAVPVPLMASRVLGVNDPGNRPVIALDNVLLLALWLGLGFGLALAIWRGALRGGALAVGVIALVLLDVFSATAPFNPTTERVLAGFDHEEAVAFLRERQAADGPFRIEAITPRWQPDLALLAGLDDIGGLFDPLSLADYDAYRARALADRSAQAYLDLNVRYVIADEEQEGPTGYRAALRTGDGLVLWEAPARQPRAWIEGSDAPVGIELVSAGRIDLTLPAGASGRLIVSQVEYPGWQATVDGRAAAVQTYAGALQAIEVPAGAREVRLEFVPSHWTLWRLGWVLGVLGWLGVAGWRVWERWRRARGGVSSVESSEGIAA